MHFLKVGIRRQSCYIRSVHSSSLIAPILEVSVARSFEILMYCWFADLLRTANTPYARIYALSCSVIEIHGFCGPW